MQGLTLDQLDHEFIGRGDPNVEGIRLQAQYEQNLTTEELQRMRQLSPFIEEFFILDHKGKTGNLPESPREKPIDQVPINEQIDLDEYARQQGIPEDEIESVMSDIYGPREGVQLAMLPLYVNLLTFKGMLPLYVNLLTFKVMLLLKNLL